MKKLYYTISVPLLESEDFMIAEGYKAINVYSIKDGELIIVLTIQIDLDSNSNEEILNVLEKDSYNLNEIELVLI